ncbi:MAG: tetratricopeptide repeat protein [Promethearchaeota archaeon]
MKLTNLTIRDLFAPDAKFTFLVGAGCSIDPPSCLPAGRAMMNSIIDYTCAKSEIKKIKELEELRFEALVEIVRDILDSELKVIDYYGQCDRPNIQHFFLANMIKMGHFIMTTNFDFLIEYALVQLGISKEEIKIIITKEDFEKFNNPQELYFKGSKTLYKIHGSTKNIIKDENTRDTLVATIQAFGSHKEGLNIFQVEPFKKLLFDNISNRRSLVIIGYSGSDDFDIVPTLKILKNVKNFIWINYIHDDQGREKIYEIEDIDTQSIKSSDKINQILSEIRRMNNTEHVYRVDANTSRLVRELIKEKPKISLENFSISTMEWLEDKIKAPSEIEKLFIPYRIYDEFDKYNEALRCLEKILQIAADLKDFSWIAVSANNIGNIYKEQGFYDDALKSFEFALQTEERLGNFRRESMILSNIGDIYHDQGKYSKALENYEKALNINNEFGDLSGKAITLNNIGTLNYDQGKSFEALKKFEEALKINEKIGNLPEKVVCLNNIGNVYMFMGNHSEALKCYEEAFQIDEKLGNLSGKAVRLKNLGVIFHEQGDYTNALRNYEKALRIDDDLGLILEKADDFSSIGDIYQDQANHDEALEYYEKSLQIYQKLRNLSGKATQLNSIGMTYEAQGKYFEALGKYNEALKIDEELNNLSGKATRLANIGEIHRKLGKYTEALIYYVDAVKIDGELGNLRGLSDRVYAIGVIYEELGNYFEAIKKYEEALQILKQLGLDNSLYSINIRENLETLKKRIN